MAKIYETVLSAQLAGIEAARAGVRGCDIDAAARAVIEQAGYGKFFGHGFGHGLGLAVHEAPTAGPSYSRELPEGAVISAEPGIYIPGQYGVRIEDVICLTREGCVNITNLPKKLLII
jgi:Xaa-Pro aminopeptidase